MPMSGAQSAPVATAGGPAWPQLTAPPCWRVVDLISDLHLDAGEPETFLAWQHYMQHTPAQAVFILGDLFEVWVGDDVITKPASGAPGSDNFEDRCAQVLRQGAARRDVYFMRGNRDFLVGDTFTRACGVHLLQDPTMLGFAGRRWLLSHGDALCLDDTDYMRFRALVRSAAWQQEFLGQPIQQRKAVARGLRERSEARKRSHPVLVDVDAQAAVRWLRMARADTLIHGHTHRPADHDLGGNLRRIVLSDWDLRASPPRAQVLRIAAGAATGPAVVQRMAIGTY